MSSFTHAYSSRAQIGNLAQAKVALAATRTSNQDIPDQSDPSPDDRRLASDAAVGRKTPRLRGGHELLGNPSEGGESPKDLGAAERSDDQEDQTPDQNLNRWTIDNPNAIRVHRGLSSLSKADGIENPKVNKNSNQRVEGHAMDLGPSNLGGKDLNKEELDLEAQQTALDLLKQDLLRKKAARAKNAAAARVRTSVVQEPRSARRGTASQTPVPRRDQVSLKARNSDSRPIRQIPPDSYISQTLNNIHRLGTGRRRSGNDPSSSSSSSDSSSESSSDPDPQDPDLDRNSPTQRRSTSHKRSSRSKGKLGSKSKHSHRSGLKPIAPKVYDGSPDARAFNRFVTEGTAFVVDGRVPRNRQVFVLSYYLDKTAYDFYIQKVSMNFSEWKLQEFFEELFNYCFPVNYRMGQRLKLKKCFQNEKKVSTYVHELEELYNMIGAVDKREKVIKLWYGLRSSIQQGLWRDRLNPETSTWEEVADHAAILEIAQSISETREESSDAEYDSITEYSTTGSESSDSENHSDAEYAPNPPGGDQLGNFPGKMQILQSNQPGSRVFHRRSTEQSQPPRDDGHFRSSKPPSSKNAIFGKRASSRGTSDLWFTPKPFEKPKLIIKEEEKAELMALGKCFICKEVGHLARDCPGENTERSSSSKLPEVPNFGIQFEEVNAENSDEVENLSTLQISTVSFISGEISPKERDITSGTPDWGAKNDIILPADHRSAPSNDHILDLVPEMTGIPWASPERLRELSAQEEVPCEACPLGDVGAAKDLEGARFNFEDFQNLFYIIADNKLELYSEKADYFAFRGPQQRKEGEGQPNIPWNVDFLLHQTFLGSVYLLNSFHFADFDHISLFSLFKLAISCFFAFYYRLICVIASFIRIPLPTRVPKILVIHPLLDDPDNRFFVSDLMTCTTPRTITFTPEQEFRLLLEPITLSLTPIACNAAITNVPAAGVPPRPVPTPVVPLGTNVSARTKAPTTDHDNGFETITYQAHFDVTHATVENPNCHNTSYTIFDSEDPVHRNSQQNIGQVLLFQHASAPIFDSNFRATVILTKHLIFAHSLYQLESPSFTPKRLANNLWTRCFYHSRVPMIPTPNSITILDLRPNRDIIRVLERTYYLRNIISISPNKKAVAFAVPNDPEV